MYDRNTVLAANRRLCGLRAQVINRYPFFGRLLMRLRFRFEECGTAATDMTFLYIDIDFLNKLSDSEAEFVLLHEVMHCVLSHCTRGKGKLPLLYNIACDIVVNSFILETLGVTEFRIDGSNAMHLAPDGIEGREHTAEEIYQMLLQSGSAGNGDGDGDGTPMEGKGAKIDSHDIWSEIEARQAEEQWGQHLREAAAHGAGIGNVPVGMRRYLNEIRRTPTTNWRQLLQDYIRYDRSDYDFMRPDRRYTDVLLPSFQDEMFGETVRALWLIVDASGSVDDEMLADVMGEIYAAYTQLDNISGHIGFFDSQLYPLQPFEDYDELAAAHPVGGGGTSFHVIFDYLAEVPDDERPELILIFTDGYAYFPPEDAALGVPVIWLIKDSDVEPPWGNCIHID